MLEKQSDAELMENIKDGAAETGTSTESNADSSILIRDTNIQMDGTMDVRTVMSMFTSLREDFKKELAEVKADILKINSSDAGPRKEELEQTLQKMDDKREEKELKRWKVQKMKNDVSIGAVQRLNGIVAELQAKIEKLEIQNAKRTMIVSGFYASNKKKTCQMQLENFFKEHMDLDIEIEELYYTGNFSPPNIVITLQSQAVKRSIFRNIGKIKTFVNRDDRKIIFKDFLLSAEYEKRKRQDDITADNEARDSELKQDVIFTGKNLKIGEFTLPKYVQVPDPTKVLDLPDEDLNAIMNIDIHYGPQLLKNNNTIMAATVEIENFEAINKAYLAVKLRFAGARHIVAAWNFPTELKYDGQDFCDNQDHGIGRAILNMMIHNDITHRVIFGIRYSSEKLQADRVPMYLKAVQELMTRFPENKILKKNQVIKEVQAGNPMPVKEKGNSDTPRWGQMNVRKKKWNGEKKKREGNNRSPQKRRTGETQNKFKFEPISEEQLKAKQVRSTVNKDDRYAGNYAAAAANRDLAKEEEERMETMN